jgi:hypothetical protein
MNDLRKDHDPHKNKLMPADAMKTCCDNSSESGAGVLTVMIQKSVDIKNLQQLIKCQQSEVCIMQGRRGECKIIHSLMIATTAQVPYSGFLLRRTFTVQ